MSSISLLSQISGSTSRKGRPLEKLDPFKPYISGKSIPIDVIPGDMYCPVAFGSAGELTAASFMAQITRGREYQYTP